MDDTDKIKQNGVVLAQIWNEKDYEAGVVYNGIEGTYKPKTPAMAKRKIEAVNQQPKTGAIDLKLKPQKQQKVEKSKFSDLFLNKKQKSASAKELPVQKVPPKAAAILHIHSPELEKEKKKKLKGMGKSESAKLITELATQKRVRRGSESDMCPNQPRGCVNPAFVYSTPPKDRKLPMSPSDCLSKNFFYIPKMNI